MCQSALNHDSWIGWATCCQHRVPWFEPRGSAWIWLLFWKITRFENCLNFQNARATFFQNKQVEGSFCVHFLEVDRGTPWPSADYTPHWITDVEYVIFQIHKCFVFIPGFIGRLYNSGNECNWTNTEQLVFTKPCPQKGFMKTWNHIFQTFQFRLNLTGTKPQFAEIFGYYITEAEIIQNRGFRSTLKSAQTWWECPNSMARAPKLG